jgi:small GTP-binding protein
MVKFSLLILLCLSFLCDFVAWACFSVGSKSLRSYNQRVKVPIGLIQEVEPLAGSTASPEDPSPKAKQDELIRELSSKFSYEGRMGQVEGSMEEEEEYRCGFVSLIGAPNMGKSTLLNAILGEDLCVATARPQTTRHAILGVLTTPTCQLCFTDTPGVIATPAYKLQEGMMEAVQGALRSADVLLVVTDPYATPIPSDALFARVRQSFQPTIVVINKIDLAKDTSSFPAAPATFKEGGDKQKEQGNEKFSVVEMVDMWRQLIPGAIAIIPVCASKGSEDAGVTALRTLLQGGPDVPAALRGLGRPIPGMFLPGVQFPSNDDARRLIPESPPLYDEDTLTDRTERYANTLG